jgi:hypothetical protein
LHSESESSVPADAAVQPLFDTKLVVILRDDVPTWQKLNATLFLVSGIAATDPTTVGPPYEDGSGGQYLPMFRQPGLVFAATRDELRRAFDRARQNEVIMAIFTDDLFSTGHDDANRAAVRAVAQDALSLVGIAFRAERKAANRIVKGLKLHQ